MSSCTEPKPENEKASLLEVEVVRRRHQASSPWTYADLDRFQRKILERVQQGGEGAVLLSEVAPVVTYGRRTPATDLLASQLASVQFGTTLYPTDRGGLATYHGPGQWVLFPVFSLETLTGDRRGVRKAVDLLLATACEVGKRYDPSAHLREGAELGVWTDRGKFAAVGIHIQGGVLLHGLSCNGFKTEASFQGLRPCGLDRPVDYLLPDSSGFEELGQALVTTLLSQMSQLGKAPDLPSRSLTGKFTPAISSSVL